MSHLCQCFYGKAQIIKHVLGRMQQPNWQMLVSVDTADLTNSTCTVKSANRGADALGCSIYGVRNSIQHHTHPLHMFLPEARPSLPPAQSIADVSSTELTVTTV